MEKKYLTIPNRDISIPAVLWGAPSAKLMIAVHGNLSNKEDTVIALAAELAVTKGYQVLSFDLPEHGSRQTEPSDNAEPYPCNPPNCVSDLQTVYEYAASLSGNPKISVFACSMGAYFSLLAYRDKKTEQMLFLSPVVQMASLIHGMMAAFQVSAERLKREKRIPLPIGQVLDWDYYSYVITNPVHHPEGTPVDILYGTADNMVAYDDIKDFAKHSQATVQILENGEHYFHTAEHLAVFEQWFGEKLS